MRVNVEYRRVDVKYKLNAFHKHELGFNTGVEVKTDFYRLHGRLLVAYKDYGWDGPSGPTIDTEDAIRASLIHDVLCQAIAEGNLPWSKRKESDKEFRRILLEDGMNWFRRQCWYLAVRGWSRHAEKQHKEQAK